MRHFILILGLLLPFLSFAQEEIQYKEYSYAELFQMIEDEEDSLFVLKDAIVQFNLDTDLRHSIYAETTQVPDLWEPVDSIHINKALEFYNVQFIVNEGDSINGKAVFIESGFHRVNFQKKVTFENTFSVLFNDCTFQSEAYFTTSWRNSSGGSPADSLYKNSKAIRDKLIHGWFFRPQSTITLQNSVLKKGLLFRSDVNGVSINLTGNQITAIRDNRFGKQPSSVGIIGGQMELFDNHFSDLVSITSDSSYSHTFRNNLFKANVSLRINDNRNLYFGENRFEGYVLMNIDQIEELKTNWQQFYKKTIPYLYFRDNGSFYTNLTGPVDLRPLIYGDDNIENFLDSTRISNPQVFLGEQERYSELYEHFKKTHNTQSANLIYIEIKDLETERLVYEYAQNPSFDLYFTIKINQFLKLFSDYGTRPSKAITFSIYVILAFALVYLFFPNHWDSHGKNRIMDRYRFFTRYMKKDTGMHDVYLEDKQSELMASEDFKVYMQASAHEIPKFFINTALPLYRWSIAGTKSASWLLSKVDVLKGKWTDTEPNKQGGKSVLLIGAFLIALTYDILIKILNALMLSINTFTTLGFGEIPIKGLPRYLAIIQGFIGWFMLTIFSVSLISQLLN